MLVRKKYIPFFLVVTATVGCIITLYIHQHTQHNPQKLEQFITSTLTACNNNPRTKEKCLAKAASDFLDKYSLQEILPILRKNEKESPYFSTCHSLTHHLGQEEFKRLRTIQKVYVQADDTCLGGVYHGAIEGYFIQKNLLLDGTEEMDQKIGEEVKTICGKPDDYPTPSQYSSCTHGLGHALMYATANDLVRALKLCDYQYANADIQNCYAGALMQNYISIGSEEHPTAYAKADDPLYPCYILEYKYQRMCYTYGIQTNFQFDPKKSIELCKSIPMEFQDQCFKNYGNYRTMTTYSPATIKAECDLIGNKDYIATCITGAAEAIVFRWGLHSTYGNELCELQSPSQQSSCYERVITMAASLTRKKEALQEYCNTILNAQAKTYCLVISNKK